FLSEQGHLPRSKAGLIVTVSIAIAVVLPLLIGAASDRIGRRPFIRWSFVAATVWAIPHFALGATGVPAYAWLGAVVSALILGTMQGVYPAKLSELFPTATRFTGTSIAYNVCFAVFGGTFPFIATWLVHATGEPMAPGWYLGVIALISTVLVWRLPETGLSPLREV
ncbi:MAG: MFS transporter, partial [Planctomycetota bacterium]|nr:MFS transporter [Planctomycetota bacterium]